MSYNLKKLLDRRRDVKAFIRRLEKDLSGFNDSAAKELALEITNNKAKLEALNSWLEVRQELAKGLAQSPNLDAAMQLFDDASHELLTTSKPGSALTFGGVAVTLLVAALLYVLWQVFDNPQTLELLGEVPIARGMITFSVTVGTIGIALAMIGATFISQADDLKERLSQGNQVLTALIAVLGTIVGFYYGISDDNGDAIDAAPEELAVLEQSLVQQALAPGDTVNVAISLTGGTPPYNVTALLIDPESEVVLEAAQSEAEGALALVALDLPPGLSGAADLRITVSDADGAELEGEPIELDVALPDPAPTPGPDPAD